MTTPQFTLDNQNLFEIIIRIIRKSEFECMCNDEATGLIMKEIEKWKKEKRGGQKIIEKPSSIGVMCVYPVGSLRQNGDILCPY